jgi:nucleoside-diphosphate-sugar epimerase
MKALITGATGFIGGALASHLTANGWEVSVLIRPGAQRRVTRPNDYRIIEADLSHPEEINRALLRDGETFDTVVHAAAIRNRWGTPSTVYYQTNVEATRNLLELAAKRARRFVYVSSVGVLGRPGVTGIDENFPIRSKKSEDWDYHSSKAESERIVFSYSNKLETAIIRPTITYGPGDLDGMVTRLVELMARKHFYRIGRGRNHVHLTYIDDLIHGIVLTMTHPSAVARTFILAGPESISMEHLLSLLGDALEVRLPEWFLPAGILWCLGFANETISRTNLVSRGIPFLSTPYITRDKVENLCSHRGYSSALAARLLGFHPCIGYPEGIRLTIDWMKQTGRLAFPLKRE